MLCFAASGERRRQRLTHDDARLHLEILPQQDDASAVGGFHFADGDETHSVVEGE